MCTVYTIRPGFQGLNLYIYIASSRPIQALTTRNLMYLMLEMGQHLWDRNMMNIQLYLQFWSSPGYQGKPTPRPPARSCSIRPLFGLFEQPKRHILMKSAETLTFFGAFPGFQSFQGALLYSIVAERRLILRSVSHSYLSPNLNTKCDNVYIYI